MKIQQDKKIINKAIYKINAIELLNSFIPKFIMKRKIFSNDEESATKSGLSDYTERIKKMVYVDADPVIRNQH